MKDFSAGYRGVAHFGLWADEGADILGQQDAFAILAAAVKETANSDVRSTLLNDALHYLQRFSGRDRPFRDFRAAPEIRDPYQRFQAMRNAAHRIASGLAG